MSWGSYSGGGNVWDAPQYQVDYSDSGSTPWAGVQHGYNNIDSYLDMLSNRRGRKLGQEDVYKQKDREVQMRMQQMQLEAQWKQLLKQLAQQKYATDVGYMSNLSSQWG